jgi:glycosyltransferase involved in cell wall biosynthesis
MESQMKLGLSMVVRNEEPQLSRCLENVHDLIDDFVVVDTGSTDNTIDVLKQRFGARVFSAPPPPDDPYVITHARNLSLQKNEADWILVLDADECMHRDHLLRIREQLSMGHDAYFLTWRNRRDGKVFDDYKLSLFRNHKNVQFEGMVHSNPQQSLRRQFSDVPLLQDVTIDHCLDERTAGRTCRKGRLEMYAERFPEWWRYKWFLGYTYFKDGDYERAIPMLRDTCNALSETFPVECLNAHFVLTEINARKGISDKCVRIMRQAEAFFDKVRADFEVRANIGMETWINRTQRQIQFNNLQEVRSYEYAY